MSEERNIRAVKKKSLILAIVVFLFCFVFKPVIIAGLSYSLDLMPVDNESVNRKFDLNTATIEPFLIEDENGNAALVKVNSNGDYKILKDFSLKNQRINLLKSEAIPEDIARINGHEAFFIEKNTTARTKNTWFYKMPNHKYLMIGMPIYNFNVVPPNPNEISNIYYYLTKDFSSLKENKKTSFVRVYSTPLGLKSINEIILSILLIILTILIGVFLIIKIFRLIPRLFKMLPKNTFHFYSIYARIAIFLNLIALIYFHLYLAGGNVWGQIFRGNYEITAILFILSIYIYIFLNLVVILFDNPANSFKELSDFLHSLVKYLKNVIERKSLEEQNKIIKLKKDIT